MSLVPSPVPECNESEEEVYSEDIHHESHVNDDGESEVKPPEQIPTAFPPVLGASNRESTESVSSRAKLHLPAAEIVRRRSSVRSSRDSVLKFEPFREQQSRASFRDLSEFE